MTVRAHLRQALTRSRLRVGVVLSLSVLLWLGIFSIFYEGFELLDQIISDVSLRDRLLNTVFNVFFLSLMIMLTVSSAIISYSLLYRSDEIKFLLTTPARPGRIVLYKLQEVSLVSCWGFLMLSSPMLLAYGLVVGASWPFYFVWLPYVVAFAIIPSVIGTTLCMSVARYLPSSRIQVFALLIAASIFGLAVMGWHVFGTGHDRMSSQWFEGVLGRLRFSERGFLPSYWLTYGLLASAPRIQSMDQRATIDCLGFLAVLSSNALFLQSALGWIAERIFVTGYSRLASIGRRAQRRSRSAFLDRLVLRACIVLSRRMRVLLVKDGRLFRRDPLQWTQFLIFFGLLGLYFINMRRFGDRNSLVVWTTVLGFLNLAAVGLIIATFTTRFIFPMISLEGRRFWILGTLPVRREQILWSKFVFAIGVTAVPCCLIVLASDFVLHVARHTPSLVVVHQVACLTICVGLSALAVGLGARGPNFREESAAKVAAGFSGTLNLLISAAYVLVVTLLTAVPSCLLVARASAAQVAWTEEVSGFVLSSPQAIAAGSALAVSLGAIVSVVAMRAGLRAFRELEF